MADIKALLKAADLVGALQAAKQQVKANPAKAEERWLLFDLFCLLGQWESAAKQLSVLRDLDREGAPAHMLMDAILQAEQVRERIFAGAMTPHFLGEPESWMSLLVEALRLESTGEHDAARKLREQALAKAPAIPGSANDQPFAWLADADSRLGPILEAHVNGSYVWVPLKHIVRVEFEPVASLRDLVWAKAYIQFTNEGTTAALIPVRYPGLTESGGDASLMLARRTEWTQPAPDAYHGKGQRLFATDEADLPLLELRTLNFAHG